MTDESTLATQPAREAQESVGVDAVERLLSAYDAETDLIPLGHEDITRGASSYNWRKTVTKQLRALYAALPRTTPPDAAATIERRVSAMDAAKQARDACMALGLPADPVAETFAAYLEAIQGTESEFREAVERAGMTGDTYIVHALDEWVARAERAEAELAVLRPGSRFTVDGVECVVVRKDALDWLNGEGDSFERPDNVRGNFWWRGEFRRRAMLSACEEKS